MSGGAAVVWDARAGLPSVGLGPARIEAHWAAQLVAAVGWTLAPARPDHNHGALEWTEAENALLGVTVGDGRTARAGLRLADLTLFVATSDAAFRAELPLAGKTIDVALGWLADTLSSTLGRPVPRVSRPPHDLPPDPIGGGAPFEGWDPAAQAELAAWFWSADRVLRALARATPGASPVRCWPHHFDIATLIALDSPGTPAGAARTIGVGLSPGDGGIAEPYWYVTPWPRPSRTAPPLAAGGWNTRGWFGALLTASAFAGLDPPVAAARVETFLSSAITACHRLLAQSGGVSVIDL